MSQSADGGKALAKGVKRILGEGPSVIPGYSKVSMRDVIFEPGATVPPNEIMNAMVCHITQGECNIVQKGICGHEGPCLDLCQGHHNGRGYERGNDCGDHADYRLARDLNPST